MPPVPVATADRADKALPGSPGTPRPSRRPSGSRRAWPPVRCAVPRYARSTASHGWVFSFWSGCDSWARRSRAGSLADRGHAWHAGDPRGRRVWHLTALAEQPGRAEMAPEPGFLQPSPGNMRGAPRRAAPAPHLRPPAWCTRQYLCTSRRHPHCCRGSEPGSSPRPSPPSYSFGDTRQRERPEREPEHAVAQALRGVAVPEAGGIAHRPHRRVLVQDT